MVLYHWNKWKIYIGWKKSHRKTTVRRLYIIPIAMPCALWNFSDTQTARALNIFRERKRHCDVRLTIAKNQYYCHKAVLVTFSKDLQNRLQSSSLWKCGKISVDLTSRALDPATVESVLNWMYTGELSLRNWLDTDKLLTVSRNDKFFRVVWILQSISL